MPTLLLDGTLTAVTPIAIILPGSEDGRTPAGAPRKRMLRDGIMVDTVYVPPSSLRGRLRHLVTQELMRLQNEADGRVFTPEAYITTALGGVKDRKAEGDDERQVDLRRIGEVRQKNPIVSLFGSMVSRVSSRLMVGDMTPLEPVAPQGTGRSVRANPFVRNPAVIGLLDPAKFGEFTSLNTARVEANKAEDQAERKKREAQAKKRAGAPAEEVEALQAEVAALTAAAKAGFEKAGGAVSIQQLLDGYDVIPEGTPMANRIRLIEGTEMEAALLLLALDLLARRPLIGGHTAHGCGEISGAWRVRVRDGAVLRDGGLLRLEPFVGLALEGADAAATAAHSRALALKEEVLALDLSAS